MVKWRQINVDSDQILKRGLEAKKSISQTKLPPYSASAAAASKPKGNSVHSLLRHMTKGKDMFVAPIDKLQLNQTWKSAVFSRVSPVQDTWGLNEVFFSMFKCFQTDFDTLIHVPSAF